MGRVALIGENSIPYISTLIDIWNEGDCAVLIDKNIPQAVVVEIMRDANVLKCCLDKKVKNYWGEFIDNSVTYEIFESNKGVDDTLPMFIYEKFKPNYSPSEAVIIYSSGTTGKSKGVILSHYAIQTNADSIAAYMELRVDDCFYLAKSLTHASTLTGELLVALKNNVRVVVAPLMVTPRYIFNRIQKYEATVLCLNPTLLQMLALDFSSNSWKYDISTLRRIYVSGAILNDSLYSFAHYTFKNIDVFNVYGLTEVAPRVTAQTKECCCTNSVGKPINGVQVCVIDPFGKEAGVNCKGVIHVKSPSLFSGYVLGCAKHSSLYKDWLNTGDIGYFDANGELHIVSRIDNVIIIDSHKIYPEDIEKEIINCSLATDCIVAKLNVNGREVLSCLYTGNRIKQHEMLSSLKDKLMTFEIPKFYVWIEKMPINANGKKMRSRAVNILEEACVLFNCEEDL